MEKQRNLSDALGEGSGHLTCEALPGGTWAYRTMPCLVRAHIRELTRLQIPNAPCGSLLAPTNCQSIGSLFGQDAFLGFVDDAAVVEFVVDKTRQTLDDFMAWETASAGGVL